MLSRPDVNRYKTTISLTLIDNDQYKANAKSLSKKLETLSTAIAQRFSHYLGAMTVRQTVNILRNPNLSTFGYQIKIVALTKESLLLEEKLQSSIESAIQESINSIDRDKQIKCKASQIAIVSMENDTPTAKFKGKPATKSYSFNSLDMLDSVEVEFIDENGKNLSCKPCSLKFKHSRWNMTGITYVYATCGSSDAASIVKLEEEAKKYVEAHADCSPCYDSIKAKDYNQALRRACAAGNLDLVKLLFRYDSKGQLNIDVNQASLNVSAPLTPSFN